MSLLYIFQSLQKRSLLLNAAMVFAISLIASLYFGTNVFIDPDVGWHIKAGEIILKDAAIPYKDTLTFASDQRWYNISWGWDVLVYTIYAYNGAHGLIWLQAALFALCAVSVYLLLSSFVKFTPDTIAVATTLCALTIWDLLYVRPQLISYLLCILALWLLRRPSSKWWFYGLPLIMIVWCNIHGSFIVVYSIIAAFAAAAWAYKDKNAFTNLLIAFVLCALVSLVNPLGYHIYYAVFRTTNSVIQQYIMEWLPFTFGREYSFSLLVLVLLCLGGFHKSNTPIEYRLLAFVWLAAALTGKRSFGYFAMLGAPFLAYTLNDFIKRHPSHTTFGPKLKYLTLAICIILLTATPQVMAVRAHPLPQIPLEAIKFLSYNCRGANVFNDYNFGGYLALWGSERNKYFIDGRAGTAFSEELLSKYIDISFNGAKIGGLLGLYKVDAAILQSSARGKENYMEYFSDWRLVYKDSNCIIYFKKGGRCAYER